MRIFTLFIVLIALAIPGFSQNAITAVASTMVEGEWKEVTQNGTIDTALTCQLVNNCSPHSGNRIGYSNSGAYDPNRSRLHLWGADHDEGAAHYIFYDALTNNWTDTCPDTGTQSACTSDGQPAGMIATISWSGTAAAGTTTYSNLPQDATNQFGTAATFTVSRSGGIYTGVTVTGVGYHYNPVASEVLTIKGSHLGGLDGTNDLTINVLTIAPNIFPTHGYQFTTVDPKSGTAYLKNIGQLNGSGTLKLYQYPVGGPWTLKSSINPIYEGQNGTTFWEGPIAGGSSGGGTLMVNNCSNAADGEVLLFNPNASSWFGDITGFAPGQPTTYQCLAAYSHAKNVGIFGGGNDTPRKVWRLNPDKSVTALADSPVDIGIQAYNMVEDPMTGNILLLGSKWTDLATSGAGATTVSSTTGRFASAYAGGVFDIYNGTNFVGGAYTIVSVTDANHIVLNVSPTPSGAGSAGIATGRFSEVWELDPDTGTYTLQTGTRMPPVALGNPAYPSGYGIISAPDAADGVTIWVSCFGTTCRMWLYKHKGLQTHTQQCAASGVVNCWSFDTSADITYGCTRNYGTCANADDPTLISRTTIDNTVFAEGGGSLHMSIPNTRVFPQAAADWYGNFSSDLSALYGCLGNGCTTEYDFYIQWRQRFSPTYLSNNWGNGSGGFADGWKMGGWGAGDTSAPTHSNSCTTPDIVFLNGNNNGFPFAEHSCVGSSSHPFPYNTIEELYPYDCGLSCTNELMEENARAAPYCLYSQIALNHTFPPNGNCYPLAADVWPTFQFRTHLGPRGAGGLINDTSHTSGTAPGGGCTPLSNVSADSQVGAGSGAKFDISCSAGSYVVSVHDTNVLTGTRGSTYATSGSPNRTTLTFLGTRFSGGATPANDLTITVNRSDVLLNVAGAPPNDEWVNSYVEMWAAADGSPYFEPIYSFGPFGWSAGNAGEQIGKLWLLAYDTNRDDTKPQADVWWDSPVISRKWIGAPVLSGGGSPPAGTGGGGGSRRRPEWIDLLIVDAGKPIVGRLILAVSDNQ